MAAGTPLRRAQLISPFGVGAMVTGPDGISAMTAGLDAWFRREGGAEDSTNLDTSEFRLEEWRLQRYLQVNEFRLPPDHRDQRTFGAGQALNTGLTVPMVRFPQVHFCRNGRCLKLTKLPLHSRGRKRCQYCAKGWLVQVPFVAVCSAGHIQDFPFQQWVHRSAITSCSGVLRLRSTGGASLAAQIVECDCGRSRTMGSVTEGAPDHSFLTSNLADGQPFLCPGYRPWHGTEQLEGCGQPIKGSLRSASNVYYAVTRSSIYLPQSSQPSVESVLEIFANHPGLATVVQAFKDLGQKPPVASLRNVARVALEGFGDAEMQAAIDLEFSPRDDVPRDTGTGGQDGDTDFRMAEFLGLRTPQKHAELESHAKPIAEYGPWVQQYFERVLLIDRLRETRALVGFERIVPETPAQIELKKRLLWSGQPGDWLPAAVVHGEGLFLSLREDSLQLWERQPLVAQRAERLQHLFDAAAGQRGLPGRELTARMALVHTLAHLLINRLTFECGYSSASLRERLYVSNGARPMAGVLIYTAAGDSEGTMGGLVRMGRPEHLTRVIARALEDATWCSADPVCMEVGSSSGQGPDSCNLAACHNCALLPETACEQFNRFLDRGLVIGSLSESTLGYFDVEAVVRT